ncbi:hypothetical protein JCGZ_22121 [Jatropha curcas]|uniref:At1g61320/AtMIF1 LRR domain-containing protein n=1 Tax=Jatropha curcas TaxID=180498 RepID=A0A067LQB0_JATCU|nr:hypothetical protein JCGZ_22121 [Jatropha curcas]
MALQLIVTNFIRAFLAPFEENSDKLKMLTVSFCKGLEEIELSATNLTTLEVFGDRTNFNIVFSDVPNLQNVLCQKPCTSSFPDDLFKQFENAAPQLQSLILSSTTRLLKYIPSSIATFGNLKQLEFIFYSGNEPYNIWKIIPVLIACPLLQIFNLTIRLGIHLYDAVNIEERTMKEIQKYHYSRLKEVEIGGFQGTETQLALALYFLKNAVELERMVISSCFWEYLTSSKRTYH